MTGGFIGMYVDVLPAVHAPADLRAYDRILVRAKQTSPNPGLDVELKLELDDETSVSTVVPLGDEWSVEVVSVDVFGDWQDIGSKVERLVIAVTHPAGPVVVAIDSVSFLHREETVEFVPAGSFVTSSPMHVTRSTTPDHLDLSWDQASCLMGDDDYAVYKGALGDFTNHEPIACSTSGETSLMFPVPEGDAYFLVAPRNAAREGSHGLTSGGEERATTGVRCLPQLVGSCP